MNKLRFNLHGRDGKADEWFRLMHNRGWYMVPEARPDVASRSVSHLQTIASNVAAQQQQFNAAATAYIR